MSKLFWLIWIVVCLVLAFIFLYTPPEQTIEEEPEIVEEPEVIIEEEPEQPQEHIISIDLTEREGFASTFPMFSQEEITVQAGESITFINNDDTDHALNVEYVVFNDADKDILKHKKNHIPAGESLTIDFPLPGEVEIDDIFAFTLKMMIHVE
jgi:plastocyanin